MKNKDVSKIFRVSRTTVSLAAHGNLKSARAEKIRAVLDLQDTEFTNVILDSRMVDVCECGVKYGKKVAVREYAALVWQMRNSLTSKPETSIEKLFNLLALTDDDIVSLLTDVRIFDVCDTAIMRSRSEKTRIFASFVKQISLKLHKALQNNRDNDSDL
jgi:succinate dehydrogenase flavin-adding protein (antitoxin of CptAB toxin-antitoxin module)